jgi:hypothetical protein
VHDAADTFSQVTVVHETDELYRKCYADYRKQEVEVFKRKIFVDADEEFLPKMHPPFQQGGSQTSCNAYQHADEQQKIALAHMAGTPYQKPL